MASLKRLPTTGLTLLLLSSVYSAPIDGPILVTPVVPEPMPVVPVATEPLLVAPLLTEPNILIHPTLKLVDVAPADSQVVPLEPQDVTQINRPDPGPPLPPPKAACYPIPGIVTLRPEDVWAHIPMNYIPGIQPHCHGPNPPTVKYWTEKIVGKYYIPLSWYDVTKEAFVGDRARDARSRLPKDRNSYFLKEDLPVGHRIVYNQIPTDMGEHVSDRLNVHVDANTGKVTHVTVG